jgi:hypothetical protein
VPEVVNALAARVSPTASTTAATRHTDARRKAGARRNLDQSSESNEVSGSFGSTHRAGGVWFQSSRRVRSALPVAPGSFGRRSRSRLLLAGQLYRRAGLVRLTRPAGFVRLTRPAGLVRGAAARVRSLALQLYPTRRVRSALPIGSCPWRWCRSWAAGITATGSFGWRSRSRFLRLRGNLPGSPVRSAYPPRRIGSGAAARVRSVGRRDEVSRGAVAISPRARSMMGILPHFCSPDHRDRNRCGALPRCGGDRRSCCAPVLACGFRSRPTPWPNRSWRQSFINHEGS